MHALARNLAFFLSAPLWVAQPIPAQPAAAPPAVVIRDVTVIDGSGGPPRPGQTVVVQGDRITAVGAVADVPVPDGARIIDGAGKFLIPGLWDMHVHATASPPFAALYVANGVTGVRDMFSPMPMIKALRARIAAGGIGPRIVAAGRIVDGEKPVWPGSFAAKNADDGRTAVATLLDEGSDFIKVYSKLSRDAYFAIAEAAKARGVAFAGHVPSAVSVAEAAAAGQASIEHMTGMLRACSSQADLEFPPETKALARAAAWIETQDAARAQALGEKLVDSGTWLCPTLTVLRAVSHLDDPAFIADERVRYVPEFWLRMWDPKNDRRFADATDADRAAQRRVYAAEVELVGLMHRAGVRFLAGTDAGNPYCFPGFGLHDELALLVCAGLSPMDALLAATRNAAEFLGLAEAGTVAPGKVASLVLLEANPLDDIGNTARIAAVVCEGRLLERAELDAILAQADRRRGD